MKTITYISRVSSLIIICMIFFQLANAQQQLKITTSSQVLQVPIKAEIVNSPTDNYVCEDGTGLLCITATGDAPITFQWLYNGNPLPETDDTLRIENITTSSSGAYQCVATNGCGSDTSAVANLTVFAKPIAYNVIGGGSFCNGGNGVNVGIDNSEIGVQYQLIIDGTTLGTSLTGTGFALDFGLQTQTGQYNVTALTTNGCTGNMAGFVMVTESPQTTLSLINSYQPTCYNACDGSLHFTASGSSGYTFSNGIENNSTGSFFGLCDGTHNVTVTDVLGCTSTTSENLTQPSEIIINLVSSLDPICHGLCDGTATVSYSGGTGILNPAWSNGQTSANAINLCAATYTVTVTDGNGCYSSMDVTILEPDSLILTESITHPSCLNNDGQIVLFPSGGVLNYTYIWDNGLSGDHPFGLSENTYNVTVTDANNCTVSGNYSLVMQSTNPIIKGLVNYSGGQLGAGDAIVKIFEEIDNPQGGIYFDLLDEQTLLANGYSFTLNPGTYILRGMNMNPGLYPQLLNTYYPNVANWEDAVQILVGCDDTVSAHIVMKEMQTYTPGTSTLSGFITYFESNDKGVSSGNGKATGEPVIGAEIFIEQEPNDVPISSTFTDTTGFYEFNNLSVGNGYRMLVEIPGIPIISTHENLSINQDGIVINNLNFFVDTTDEIGGIFIDTLNSISTENMPFTSIDIFPNPSHDFVNIVLDKVSENTTITLLDENGRNLFQNMASKTSNQSFKTQISLNKLSKGNYYIKISTRNTCVIKKILKE